MEVSRLKIPLIFCMDVIQGYKTVFPIGPTTAEQRHLNFSIEKAYKSQKACRWDGPSWPFSTSITLTALANYLNESELPVVGKKEYFELLKIYTNSHQLQQEGGSLVSWIDESLDPYHGNWITRDRFNNQNKDDWGSKERGKDYNHSTYCDLIINGLIGIRPGVNSVTINPLVPADSWDWFCLNEILIKGKSVAVVWDKTGWKFGVGEGFLIFSDGDLVFKSENLGKITLKL